jgi:hypothetical protein
MKVYIFHSNQLSFFEPQRRDSDSVLERKERNDESVLH